MNIVNREKSFVGQCYHNFSHVMPLYGKMDIICSAFINSLFASLFTHINGYGLSSCVPIALTVGLGSLARSSYNYTENTHQAIFIRMNHLRNAYILEFNPDEFEKKMILEMDEKALRVLIHNSIESGEI
jgi:hypothetical protein